MESITAYARPVFKRIRSAWHLYRYALRDVRTPTSAKILPLLSLVYLLWPIDILPDVLPIIGQLDDVTMIIGLFSIALRMIPKNVKRDAKMRVIDIEPKK